MRTTAVIDEKRQRDDEIRRAYAEGQSPRELAERLLLPQEYLERHVLRIGLWATEEPEDTLVLVEPAAAKPRVRWARVEPKRKARPAQPQRDPWLHVCEQLRGGKRPRKAG